MGLELLKTKKLKLHEITFYSKEALEILVLQYNFLPEDIVEHYGVDQESGKLKYTLKKVIEDLHTWNINPQFIQGYDVVDNMRKSIREYDKTIKTYTKNNSAKYPEIAKVVTLLDKIHRQLKDNSALEGLEGLLSEFLKINIDIVEFEKLRTKNEEIRIKYLKLRQDENKNLMMALKIQAEAIEQEAFLTSTLEELKLIDLQGKTNYAQFFIANIKTRMEKKINDKRVLGRGSLTELKEKVEKKLKPVNKVHIVNKDFKINIDKIASDFDIHYQTAQTLYSEWSKTFDKNGNPTEEPSKYLDWAKEKAHKSYSYIGPDGKKMKGKK